MANPYRGRGGFVNGRGGGPSRDAEPSSTHRVNGTQRSETPNEDVPNYRSYGGSRGSGPRGGAIRGGNPNALGGRGGFTGGRGVVPPPRGGGFRGRGRGQGSLWNTS